MKPNQLATLTLRLLGIYCLIDVIPSFTIIPTAVAFAQSEPIDGRSHMLTNVAVLVAAFLPFIIKLVAGVLLLVYSKTWGERLAQQEVAAENLTTISFEQVQVLTFAGIGILIFADALPQLFNSIFHLLSWMMAGQDDWQRQNSYRTYSSREVTVAIGIIAKAILGLVLFFRARGFAHFWRSLRSFATPQPPQN